MVILVFDGADPCVLGLVTQDVMETLELVGAVTDGFYVGKFSPQWSICVATF